MDGSLRPYERGWPTNHAIARMEERYQIVLDAAVCAAIVSAVSRSRLIMAAAPGDLRACVQNGAVHTKLSPSVAEHWCVKIGSRWVNLVIDGARVITVIPPPENIIRKQSAARAAHRRQKRSLHMENMTESEIWCFPPK